MIFFMYIFAAVVMAFAEGCVFQPKAAYNTNITMPCFDSIEFSDTTSIDARAKKNMTCIDGVCPSDQIFGECVLTPIEDGMMTKLLRNPSLGMAKYSLVDITFVPGFTIVYDEKDGLNTLECVTGPDSFSITHISCPMKHRKVRTSGCVMYYKGAGVLRYVKYLLYATGVIIVLGVISSFIYFIVQKRTAAAYYGKDTLPHIARRKFN